MNKVERAIILAAGKGERMLPLTKSTPKPLIEVLGQPIIEHTIEILHQKNIFEIYIVVGYLSEKFNYLSEKYNVTLVKNPLYNECNNISSMFFAKDYLKNAVVLDGDIWIQDVDIIKNNFDCSGYTSIWTSIPTREWLQQTDDKDFVTSCSRTGGESGWILYSISYWTKDDAAKLSQDIHTEFVENKNTSIYWDDVAIFCYPEKYKLKIKKAATESFLEFDNLEELAAFDPKYQEVLNEN